jgi:hypothetical protein
MRSRKSRHPYGGGGGAMIYVVAAFYVAIGAAFAALWVGQREEPADGIAVIVAGIIVLFWPIIAGLTLVAVAVKARP